jgi:hypothetical protein
MLDVKILPVKGDAIVWMNVEDNVEALTQEGLSSPYDQPALIEEALHEGMPPNNQGVVKFACNVWIREEAIGKVDLAEAYKTS